METDTGYSRIAYGEKQWLQHSSSSQPAFCRPGITLWNDSHETRTEFVDVKIKSAYLQLCHRLVTSVSLSRKSLPFSLKRPLVLNVENLHSFGVEVAQLTSQQPGNAAREPRSSRGTCSHPEVLPFLALCDVNPSPLAEVFQTLWAVCYCLYCGMFGKTEGLCYKAKLLLLLDSHPSCLGTRLCCPCAVSALHQ